ncbi:MAG: hypothetical protein QM704_25915 [Anaeromyxobacteraceae bacterium]
MRVRLPDRGEDLRANPHHALGRERELVGQEPGEAAPAHELHREEGHALVGPAEVEHGDGVRVAEPGRRPRLALEALRHGRVVVEADLEELHRHGAIEGEIGGAEDAAHAAAADERVQAVLAADGLAELPVGRDDDGHGLGHRGRDVRAARLAAARLAGLAPAGGAFRHRLVSPPRKPRLL